ncbi:MAG: hypothetical protein IPM46_13480 [Flavobacteriales bacterium]|nr:hypothetical protein [Flavobacteriales bacterium]
MHAAGTWRVKVGGGLALLLSLVLSGCVKRDSFPPEPTLKFKSFTQFGDSASLVVLFTDGDGDIGLDDSDNQPPFNTGSDYYYNLFLEYEEYRSVTASWVPISLALPLRYRIPRITPTGQNKALEGEIAVALAWPIIPDNVVDTVRFQVRLVDRALRESNRVPTDPIIETN